jgi:hypothetical protein
MHALLRPSRHPAANPTEQRVGRSAEGFNLKIAPPFSFVTQANLESIGGKLVDRLLGPLDGHDGFAVEIIRKTDLLQFVRVPHSVEISMSELEPSPILMNQYEGRARDHPRGRTDPARDASDQGCLAGPQLTIEGEDFAALQ